MKRILCLISFSLFVLAAKAEEKPYLTKTFGAASLKMVQVETISGSIAVTGGHENEARVEVFVSANNGKKLTNSEIEEILQHYKLTINTEGDKLVCKVRKLEKATTKAKLSIAFKVYVPKNIDTDLLTSGGGIKLQDLKGNLKFMTSGGGMSITNASGVINGVTSGGGIVAEQISGQVDLITSGGGIKITNATGVLNATTSGGGIVLAAVQGNIKAHTSGGGISAEVKKIDDYLELHTGGGSINADIPTNHGLDLDISGSNVHMAKFEVFEGQVQRTHVRGKVRGGGADVKISTSGGSVNIN